MFYHRRIKMEDQAEQMDKPKNRGRRAALQDEHLDDPIDIILNNETFKTQQQSVI